MATLTWLIVRGLLGISYLTNPVAATNEGRSFSVKQVPGQDRNVHLDTPMIFARNLVRYGGSMPPNVPHVHSAEMASVMAVAPNREFLIPVSVGAETLHLSVDTGSSDLWVFSRHLSEDRRQGHEVYRPSVYSSRTSKTWAVRYADGSSASGDVYHDVVGVEGIWVMQQAVEVATEISDNLAHDPGMDGVIGLGFSNLNKVRPERENTFFDNAKSQLKLPLFATTLKRNGLGSYDFGYVDRSKYTGELSYVDVDSSRGHWSFKVSGYDLGDGKIISDPLKGVIDTGASLIFLPEHIVQAYYKQVIGAELNNQFGEWTVPCSTSLPSFTTNINEYKAKVSGELLKLDPIVPGSPRCLGGIQSNMNASASIFGHVFLNTQYVVFDDSGPRLGFAAQL